MLARHRAHLSLLLLAAMAGCAVQPAGAGPASGSAPPTVAPAATLTASPTPTIEPTPTPTPVPTPTPDPFALDLEAIGCEGGVVLEWSPSADPDFHHYVALRSPQKPIATDYPPIAPAVDWGDSYATDRFVTSAVDASILPSETPWNYRVMAYDASGRVVGASQVRVARIRDRVSLGTLEVEPGPDGATRIEWNEYRGRRRCFSEYRVVFSIGGGSQTVLSVVSDQHTSEIDTKALHAGTAYQLRVLAVRTSLQGSFVLGQTEASTYTVP